MSPKTVLLVDDDPDLTEAHSQVLESAGFEVLVAHDGVSGFTLATRLDAASAGFVRTSTVRPTDELSTSTTQRRPFQVTALMVTCAAAAGAATTRSITGTRHS